MYLSGLEVKWLGRVRIDDREETEGHSEMDGDGCCRSGEDGMLVGGAESGKGGEGRAGSVGGAGEVVDREDGSSSGSDSHSGSGSGRMVVEATAGVSARSGLSRFGKPA